MVFNALNCKRLLGSHDGTFEHCPNITSLTIGKNVTRIPKGIFCKMSGLISVEIPNSVTTIEDGAFYYSKLTSVTIGESVRYIGEEAFYSCSNLKAVNIPNSVKTIGNGAFQFSGLTSITLGNSVDSIGDDVCGLCKGLTDIYIYRNR